MKIETIDDQGDGVMKIEVTQCDWGTGCRHDIKAVLDDVASHLAGQLRTPFDGTVEVLNLPGEEPPRALYRDSGVGNFLINLTAKDRHWCQYSYQFAHELCHVLSGYERLRDNPNNWFHEAICELASLFVLRRMAQSWASHPPFQNWKGYAPHLADYADCWIKEHCARAPSGSFNTWLSDNEAELRRDCYLRDKNGVAALQLLPLFENDPTGWNAVRRLPDSKGMIDAYIDSWKCQVDAVDRSFVEKVQLCLGFKV